MCSSLFFMLLAQGLLIQFELCGVARLEFAVNEHQQIETKCLNPHKLLGLGNLLNELASIYFQLPQILLAFSICKLKPKEDILQGISKLDCALKVSVFQLYKDPDLNRRLFSIITDTISQVESRNWDRSGGSQSSQNIGNITATSSFLGRILNKKKQIDKSKGSQSDIS